jgi:hypothetical protein
MPHVRKDDRAQVVPVADEATVDSVEPMRALFAEYPRHGDRRGGDRSRGNVLDCDAKRVKIKLGKYRLGISPHTFADALVGEIVGVAARPKSVDRAEELFGGLDTAATQLLPFHPQGGGEHSRVQQGAHCEGAAR